VVRPSLEEIDLNKYRQYYPENYFAKRDRNDPRRLEAFSQEKQFIFKHLQRGTVCDVGCSTGEFLDAIGWEGDRYGMEISEHAAALATTRGIAFDKNILNRKGFFDLVIFRGTIQHVPYPFLYMHLSYEALKPGGYIVFLATPNANSPYYKLFNTLPMLSDSMNFYIPSDRTLANGLRNIGFQVLEIEYPYLWSPYAHLLSDHLKFVTKVLFRTNAKFAFWRSSMNLIAVKDPT
jgi:SAM-dependent methyltransferase